MRFPAAPSAATTGHMAMAHPAGKPRRSLISSVNLTLPEFQEHLRDSFLPTESGREKGRPGLLVRKERLSVERRAGPFAPESDADGITRQLECLRPGGSGIRGQASAGSHPGSWEGVRAACGTVPVCSRTLNTEKGVKVKQERWGV